ncbi:MAG: hypothetical protein JXR96_21610 [Deltaproteobacteria bacterium]|nr:hypothetical protein [Deltaproteobacteria bacterium]
MDDGKIRIARLIGAVLALLAATVFVDIYSSVQMNILRHGFKYSESVLPSACSWVYRGAFVGYVLAAALLAAGVFAVLRERKRLLLLEVAIQLGFLLAFASVLVCLIAWWLPHTYGVSEVR